MATTDGIPLPKAFRSEFFPLDRLDPGGDITEVLSKILVSEYTETVLDPGPGGGFLAGLSVAEELVINLIGLNGFAIVLGGASTTSLALGADWDVNTVKVRIGGGARLRFPREILKPVTLSGDAWVDDPSRAFAEITMAAGIIIDQDWNVTFDGANAFTLPPVMIADSGFVLEGEVALDFSETTQLPESAALGLPASWRGVVFRTLTAHLPQAMTEAVPVASVAFNNFHIGSGGVSGSVTLNGAAGAGQLAGFPFSATAFGIELRQNTLTGVSLAGNLTLPFFDAPLAVDVGFDLQGNLTVGLTGAGGAGLVTLDKPGLLTMQLDSVTFQRAGDVFGVTLGGKLTPKVGGLDWPTFGVEALTIDNKGHVTIEGGWIELRDQYVLNFYGFQFSISRIGFGTATSGDRWIGFNGDLKLVDGLTAGASVEGMRINWSPTGAPNPHISLEGVGVEFDIPDVLSFRGFVAMREPEPGVFRFDGDITLELVTPELSIDGQLVVGYNKCEDFTFFAIYVAVELPVGIPLWSTGLGLYGIAGLFALNMEPGRKPEEAWYEIPPGESWYHRNPPGVGVANLRKWDDTEGSLGLGAGITIGTVVDNGFTFAGRMLLAIVFPGPIIFVEGRANVLKPRSSLDDEPVFRALLVIDGREGTLTAGLDAKYSIADGGELIDLHGSLEAFFDFTDLSAWHLYLGIDEPRERRIGADIFFRIFHADSYFMIDAHRVKTGAWTGVEKNWKFGPLRVTIEAWIEGNAELSFKPVHYQSSLSLHGGFAVTVFRFGFHLGATATVAAGVFDPFHIKADFNVTVGLPWPLPDFDVDFSLEWGPEPTPPLLPVPVKEVAIGHDIVTTTWPLAAGSLLLPDMNAGAPQPEFFDNQPPTLVNPDQPPPPAAALPVVPMDGRPEITFGRSVHDDALAGANAQPQYVSAVPAGWSRLGDPAHNQGPVLIRPALTELRLDGWTGGGWQGIAQAGTGPDPATPGKLYGSWMPVPSEPGGGTGPGQTKLRVWSKTPFSFTRHTGAAWTDSFLATYPNYPCIEVPRDRRDCCDFSSFEPGDRPTPPWACKGNDAFVLTWSGLPLPAVEAHGGENGLCFPPAGKAIVVPTAAVKELIVDVYSAGRGETDDCVDFRGRRRGRAANPRREAGRTFTVYWDGGTLAEVTEIRAVTLPDETTVTGLECGIELRCDLPWPSATVRVLISSSIAKTWVSALDANGNFVAKKEVSGKGIISVTFVGGGIPIEQIVVSTFKVGSTLLHEICSDTGKSGGVVLEAVDGAGNVIASDYADTGTARVPGSGAANFVVRGAEGGRFCLVRVCAIVGLSTEDQLAYGNLVNHVVDELARWQADDVVLPPYTTFRLKLVSSLGVQLPPGSELAAGFAGTRSLTQVAYFRTEGPPGLASLANPGAARVPGAGSGVPQDPPTLQTGLDDLTRYVAQTVPATIAPRGTPKITRPVYRGYDVGVSFAANYVDLMYALAGRDLSLAIYDMNDRPVRDAQGRILTLPNRWGRTDNLSVNESEQRWLEVLDRAHCTGSSIDLGTVARNKAASLGGFVLDPATNYEARLVPLLAVDGFDGYLLGTTASGTGSVLSGSGLWSWTARDEGAAGGPSKWRIGEAGTPADRYVEQLSSLSGGPAQCNAAFPGGALLLLNDVTRLAPGDPTQPSRWGDYRLSGYVRSTDSDVIGFGVRMNGRRGYLVKLDQRRNLRQLVLVRAGSASVLAQRAGGFALDTGVHVSIEAVGNRLRVYVDGEEIFDIIDRSRSSGTIALYASSNAGVRFTEVRVDDLRPQAPVVYRFKFTTSAFADFRHHLGSGDDRVDTAAVDAAALATAFSAAVDPAATAARVPASETEARAYDAVARSALGPAANRPAERAEAIRLLGAGGATAAILLRTAEPIDWTRGTIQLAAADAIPAPVPATGVKLISTAFAGGAAPNPQQESLRLLLLDDHDLSHHVVEARILASPGAPDLPDGTPTWDGDFLSSAEIGDGGSPTIWAPALVDLSDFTLELPATGNGAADWQAADGVLSQTGTFTTADDFLPGFPLERPARGTLAIGPLLASADIRIDARFAMQPTGAAGVVFRCADAQNCYRFAIDRRRNRRVLSRFVAGSFQVLHSSGLPLLGAGTYQLRIEAVGSRLSVWVDGAAVCSVVDASLGAGAVGFYSQGAPLLQVDQVTVERISHSLGDWRIDDLSPSGDRGIWRIAHGALTKDTGPASTIGESFAVIEGQIWADLRLSGTLVPPAVVAGECGFVWRYASTQDHVRLAVDPAGATARIVARRVSTDITLWNGAWPATTLPPGLTQWAVTIETVGHRLRVSVDGALLAEVEDAGLGAGTVGAFAGMAGAVAFGPLAIEHAAPAFEPWYGFGAEPTRVSGRRIRIGASAAPANYASPAGEEARWKNRLTAGFRRGLPLAGVDLRVVDAAHTVLHQRRFRPGSAYGATAMVMARAADSTGLLVLPAGGGGFPQGELRLDFEYRRDNTSVDPQSLILRQEGEQTTETVSIFVA